MELLVGPAFTIDVTSPSYAGDHHTREKEEQNTAVPSRLFLSEAGRCSDDEYGSGFRIGGRSELSGDSSESSSSIGTPDDESGDEEEEYEVQSKLNGGLGLDSLEDSLPIKRGLSGHFNGKSKSFTDLAQVSCVKELQKQENPFNKRRRLIMASKWSKRSSFYTWSNPKSMPLLPLHEQEEQVEEEEEDKQEDQLLQMPLNRVPESYAAKMRLRLGNFNVRSFSLADLQEHDEQEDG